ncbi:hypothetical protein H6P81_005582 [Aristolochia fimbriata]|uniref:3'-5' exonuclease domain-containing protein n=1 Tax=Aristolochia fimbriata TaxID=158543 RepID=A0AAV7EV12_ARIFI|nr:hypothetical protein H6P81_005582 [Aristolochia fimbriata]
MDGREAAIGKLPFEIHFVSSIETEEFSRFQSALSRSSVIGLDAEWKPCRTPNSTSFPPVSLLQIACGCRTLSDRKYDFQVFLLDLQSLPLPAVWKLLVDMFVSPNILKLGFRFKQDLAYLSSTFCARGCEPGFTEVEPYVDILSIYHHLREQSSGKKLPKESKSLAAICNELLGVRLAKEFQCSDWSLRPLTEEQKSYAAADAYYLLEIFSIFQFRFLDEGNSLHNTSGFASSNGLLGLKMILQKSELWQNNILRPKVSDASTMIRSISYLIQPCGHSGGAPIFHSNMLQIDSSLRKIFRKYGERIILTDSDRRPKVSRKEKKHSTASSNAKKSPEPEIDWQAPAPWDCAMGGDGCPKFLCDFMVEGLAKHLRCVGIDAAVPFSRKPEPRELLNQAHREKRVVLTRDRRLLSHQYLVNNQVYRVKSLLKNDQLVEVINTFQLKISEDQLMSRCTKCNGRFIQKPMTTEEAIEAAKGIQVIPKCLFGQNLEFWQCMNCSQVYWEGSQYHSAVQQFVDLCKLKE